MEDWRGSGKIKVLVVYPESKVFVLFYPYDFIYLLNR